MLAALHFFLGALPEVDHFRSLRFHSHRASRWLQSLGPLARCFHFSASHEAHYKVQIQVDRKSLLSVLKGRMLTLWIWLISATRESTCLVTSRLLRPFHDTSYYPSNPRTDFGPEAVLVYSESVKTWLPDWTQFGYFLLILSFGTTSEKGLNTRIRYFQWHSVFPLAPKRF